MHKFIDYTNLPEDQKDEAALKDFKEFIGDNRYIQLVSMAENNKFPSLEYFRDTCAIMLEVEGFPVEAFIRKYLGNVPPQGQPLVVEVEERAEYTNVNSVT